MTKEKKEQVARRRESIGKSIGSMHKVKAMRPSAFGYGIFPVLLTTALVKKSMKRGGLGLTSEKLLHKIIIH